MSITIKRAQTTVELCTDLSLTSEHERLSRELAEARTVTDDREISPAAKTAKAITDLEEQMAASTLVFVLAALPRKRYAEIVAEHPPRDGDSMDEAFGLNTSTAIDVIITEPGVVVAVTEKATGAAVEFDATQWPDLADEMSNSQWEEFGRAAITLNQGKVSAPFSLAASALTRRSAATSKQQSD